MHFFIKIWILIGSVSLVPLGSFDKHIVAIFLITWTVHISAYHFDDKDEWTGVLIVYAPEKLVAS